MYTVYISGWWFGCHEFGIFPLILGCSHHPNWRTHIFQRGGPTTNQICIQIKGTANKPPRCFRTSLLPFTQRYSLGLFEARRTLAPPHYDGAGDLGVDENSPIKTWMGMDENGWVAGIIWDYHGLSLILYGFIIIIDYHGLYGIIWDYHYMGHSLIPYV